jgi:hypothetical protein
MNRLHIVIGASTALILFYVWVCTQGWIGPALFLFSLTQLAVLAVVYVVLKDPNPSKLTFDEAMYEDLKIPFKVKP